MFACWQVEDEGEDEGEEGDEGETEEELEDMKGVQLDELAVTEAAAVTEAVAPPRKRFVIDSRQFEDDEGFHTHVRQVLTQNLGQDGHSLDALRDLLRGGFGNFAVEEQIEIHWVDFAAASAKLRGSLPRILEVVHESSNVTFSHD